MSQATSKKDRMFQRLANMMKERFDTNITFTDFTSRLRVADVKAVTAVQRNPMASFIATDKDMVLPIRTESQLYGFITLFDGIYLKEAQLEQIRQVTDLLLTESCLLEDKAQRMKVVEHHIKTFNSLEDIIDLRTKMKDQEINFINPEISIPHENLDSVFPILIESHSIEDAQELAVEIHRTSNRTSFLTYESYIASELTSVEKIKSLGPITLFIPNLSEVPLDMQMTLESYLHFSSRTTHHPRIICAVQENPDELVKTGEFHAGLYEKIRMARVKLPPKGTSSMTIEEMMGFFTTEYKMETSNERHLYLVNPKEPSH